MALALRGAAACDADCPVDEALSSIGSVLSNLGSEVSGLAMRHTREVAFLRAESSFLARELRELREARQKRRSSKQRSVPDVPSGFSSQLSNGALEVSCPSPTSKLADPIAANGPHMLPSLPQEHSDEVKLEAPASTFPTSSDEAAKESDRGSIIKARGRNTRRLSPDAQESACWFASSIPGEEKVALCSASLRDDVSPAAQRRSSSEASESKAEVCLQAASFESLQSCGTASTQTDGMAQHSLSEGLKEHGCARIDGGGQLSRKRCSNKEAKGITFDDETIVLHASPSEDACQEEPLHAAPTTSWQESWGLGSQAISGDAPFFTLCQELQIPKGHKSCAQLETKTFTYGNLSTSKSNETESTPRIERERKWRCVVSPVSERRMVWEFSGLFILFWDMVFIPMQAFEIPEHAFLDLMGWVTLVYWTIDFGASFMVGYYSQEGKLIMDYKSIAIRYLKTWLLLDLMIIGIDWFPILGGLFTTGQVSMGYDQSNVAVMRAGKVLRILRLVRLLRVMKLSQSNFVLMLQERLASETFFVVSNLMKNVCVLLAVSHFCACGWYTIGCIENQEYGNWVAKYEMARYSWVWAYTSSVHWALAQFANGEVLIEPQNIAERIMCVLVLMASLVIFSSFVAIVGNTVQQLIQRGSQLRIQQWMLRLYLRQNGISLDLKMRINRYVGVMTDSRDNRISETDVKLVELLSRPLQVELQTEVFLKHLIMHPFFVLLSKRSFNITRNLCCNAVCQVLLSRGDTLFSVGEEVHLMYFITGGNLQYTPSNKVAGRDPVVSLEQNNFFCEAVLWTDRWLSCGIMRAETECELVGLDGQKFREVMTQYHTANMMLPKDYGAAFVQGLNESLKCQGIFAMSDMQLHLLQTTEVQTVLVNYTIKCSNSHDEKRLRRALPKKAYDFIQKGSDAARGSVSMTMSPLFSSDSTKCTTILEGNEKDDEGTEVARQ